MKVHFSRILVCQEFRENTLLTSNIRVWRACMMKTKCMSAGDPVEHGERTRLGCGSTRLASNLPGWCERFESPPHAQCLAGGRGIRRNARGRACSPNRAAPPSLLLSLVTLLALQVALIAAEDNLSPFRPPAVPLVACDPYFSIWS